MTANANVNDVSASSALYYVINAQASRTQIAQSSNVPADPAFDANRNNAIYQDGVTTVRPDAFRAYCLIRYS